MLFGYYFHCWRNNGIILSLYFGRKDYYEAKFNHFYYNLYQICIFGVYGEASDKDFVRKRESKEPSFTRS